MSILLGAALLIPLTSAAVAAPFGPSAPAEKLHVCITKDKMLRVAPGNRTSFCKPEQKTARLATKTQKGAPGQDGVSGWQRVVGDWSADTEAQRTVTATCPAGKNVIGGGFESGSVSAVREVVVLSSFPSDSSTWSVTANSDATNGDRSFAIRAYALCVALGG